ncbi:MAG: hypothetical protein H7A35_15860 [Planctomycetales bacterium]|nr:hypothetical protein [bacterium]UNM08304.1 MAG: hypothetical protein H7A35_15860 [Planctomycetales bacterium]
MINRLIAHIMRITRGWVTALLDIRRNPLPAAWGMSESRGNAAYLKRFAIGMGLYGIASWLGIIASASYLTGDQLANNKQSFVNNYFFELEDLGNWLLQQPGAAWCLLLALAWLLVTFRKAITTSLGFLDSEPRQQTHITYDDMLACSQLNEYEVLLGALYYCVRLVFLPLLAFSICCAYSTYSFFEAEIAGNFNGGLAGLLAHMFAAVPLLFTSGMLAAIALFLLTISLSLSSRQRTAPQVGGFLHTTVQFLLIVLAAYLLYSQFQYWGFTNDAVFRDFGNVMFSISFLVTTLMLYLARRLNWLRMLLQQGFPVLLGAFHLFCALPLAYAYTLDSDWLNMLSIAADGLRPLSLSATALQASWLQQIQHPYWARGDRGFEYYAIVSQLIVQLAYLALFAEFARDAVRRRKWGVM